jgi:hypothetical protein
MTLQAITGGLWIPGRVHSSIASMSVSSLLIDAAAEKIAFVFRVPKSGTLDKFEFMRTTVAQAPSNGLKCSFQDIDLTTGDPDGVADQYRVVSVTTAAAWTVPGLMTSTGADGGVKRVVPRGDLLAAVVEFQSFNASDSALLLMGNGNGTDSLGGSVFVDHYTGAWSKQYALMTNIGLKYDDGTYGFVAGQGGMAIQQINTTTFNSTSGINELGLYFKFPVPVTVGGFWARVDVPTVAADFSAVLYDTDGTTPLATATVDGDLVYTGGRNIYGPFPSEVTCARDTFYRLSIKPTTANNISVYDIQTASAALMDAHEGGQSFYYSQRTGGGGSWAETATRRLVAGLLVTAIDDGRKIINHPGLSGGLL